MQCFQTSTVTPDTLSQAANAARTQLFNMLGQPRANGFIAQHSTAALTLGMPEHQSPLRPPDFKWLVPQRCFDLLVAFAQVNTI